MTARRRRLVTVTVMAVALLGIASAAWADPAKPSNYRSRIVDGPPGVGLEIRGGDSFVVLEVPEGTSALVTGYDSDEEYDDWAELEEYLRVLPDGTVQLNERSAAYFQNAARYGASPDGPVGVDVPQSWTTVADDGRVAWHDHRIHWMSPVLPDRIDPDAGVQEVLRYEVPVVVDGEIAVGTGELEFVPDPSPVPVLLVALGGVVVGALLARRDRRAAAVAMALAGGVVTAVLVAAGIGRPALFDVATPPVVLAAVGAAAPLLGSFVASLRDTQRRGLILLGAISLVVFGVLATGLLDPLLGGGGTGEGGFGNWWLRPTLPIDVLPGVLRLAVALATGLGVALLADIVAGSLAVPGGLDGLDAPDAPDDGAASVGTGSDATAETDRGDDGTSGEGRTLTT